MRPSSHHKSNDIYCSPVYCRDSDDCGRALLTFHVEYIRAYISVLSPLNSLIERRFPLQSGSDGGRGGQGKGRKKSPAGRDLLKQEEKRIARAKQDVKEAEQKVDITKSDLQKAKAERDAAWALPDTDPTKTSRVATAQDGVKSAQKLYDMQIGQ